MNGIMIYGYPRSGSTMLMNIIKRHRCMYSLGEPLTPAPNWVLVANDAGLVMKRSGMPETQTYRDQASEKYGKGHLQFPEARWEVFKRFHLKRQAVFKVLSAEVWLPGLVELMNEHYRVITVERRNALAAYLSGLIATHHRIWTVQVNKSKPEYRPFVVSEARMVSMAKYYTMYYTNRNRFNVQGRVFYEDMVRDGGEATMQRLGMYEEGNYTDPGIKKIHSFDEKVALIKNYDEVVDCYNMLIAPVAPKLVPTKL